MAKMYVAAHRDGRSTIVREQSLPSRAFRSVPGFDPVVVWGTEAKPVLPWNGEDLAANAATVLPDVGGTRFFIVTFPPDAVMAAPGFDPMAAGAEYAEKLPGLAQQFEPENPGMHTTETIDYDIVLDGEISIEFDNGETVELKAGDVVVQHGTRHAWRNKSSKPATLAFILIGATKNN